MRNAASTEDRIGAQRVGSEARPPSYAGGRVCAQRSCGTRLSIYNPDPYCALHSLPIAVERRRRRPGVDRAPAPSGFDETVVLDKAS